MATIHRALPKATDAATRANLQASLDTIAKALDPTFAPAAAAAGGGFGRGGLSVFDLPSDTLDCWPDYRITRDGGGVQP